MLTLLALGTDFISMESELWDDETVDKRATDTAMNALRHAIAVAPDDAQHVDFDFTPLAQFAAESARNGSGDIIPMIEPLVQRWPSSSILRRILGFACRDEQRMEDALAALKRAKELAPDDLQTRFAFAQINFETGRPAAELFLDVKKSAPDSLALIRSSAVALAAEREGETARTLLVESLNRHPGWIDGHKVLANLRITSGESDFTQSFRNACAAAPQDKALRLAWFHSLALAKDWEAARTVIHDGERLMGAQLGFTLATIFIASESGEAANDDALFDQVETIRDPGLDLCHIRHALRAGHFDKAEAIGLRNLNTPAATTFWPYLALVWRLTGNSKAEWLEGNAAFIRVCDLGYSATELQSLSATLRALHSGSAPYLDQSVRGGTQTERPLLFRNDPIIQQFRGRATQAIGDYIAGLPPHDPAHPLLAPPRGKILFEGSWSVRLASLGYHACHTHPMGWISSAFYASLPSASHLGPPPSGWLRFGAPPPELNLDLKPFLHVEPKAGQLVLFPSTMWHGTEPFTQGERLTIAFDVRRHT